MNSKSVHCLNEDFLFSACPHCTKVDNADSVLEVGNEPVRDQVRRPDAGVNDKETAFGGTILIEFIAFRAKT